MNAVEIFALSACMIVIIELIIALIILENKIKNVEERFILLKDATGDGVMDIDLSTNKLFLNPEWQELLGIRDMSADDLIKNFLQYLHPGDRNEYRNRFLEFMQNGQDKFDFEYRMLTESRNIMWVHHRGKVVERKDNGAPSRIVSVLSDITERKNREEEIWNINHTDFMTGLRNRPYLEEKLQICDQEKLADLTLIIADINGLKRINDLYGRAEGNTVLRVVANILKSVCSSDDIVTRWGGDTFVVLSLNKSKNYGDILIEKIEKSTSKIMDIIHQQQHGRHPQIVLSLAFGYAKAEKQYQQTEEIMKLAEERMLRSKLLNPASVRSEIVQSLENSLYEKSNETQEHTQRICKLCRQFGVKIGLSHEFLDELELLGMLHDIGKIGIPESILNKTDKLSADEWKIMKSHAEIGYRIAASIPDICHIADYILHHHERFDGSGYPDGVSGTDIPLPSRILSIVDSYDVITHDRPYKKAFDSKTAINDIRMNAGRQFDPSLTETFISLIEG